MILRQWWKDSAKFTEIQKRYSEQLFRHCDKIGLVDDSVEMTYEEYKQHWLAVTELGEYKKMFQIAFEILDINGDDVIRLEEWKAHSAAVRVPPEWVEATFDAIDKDGDGKITKKEFIGVLFLN